MQQVGQVISVPQGLTEIDAAIFLVRFAEKATAKSRELLYKIWESNSWQDRFSSWSEFVQSKDGLGKSKGWASKQLAIHKYFVIEGNFSTELLGTVDSECLYLASRLPSGTPQEKLLKAQVWDRDELNTELASKDGVDCLHPEIIQICASCHKRV